MMPNNDWEKGFNDGIFYCVQQLFIFNDMNNIAAYLIIESGISEGNFLQMNKDSGFQEEKMAKFITEVFENGS